MTRSPNARLRTQRGVTSTGSTITVSAVTAPRSPRRAAEGCADPRTPAAR